MMTATVDGSVTPEAIPKRQGAAGVIGIAEIPKYSFGSCRSLRSLSCLRLHGVPKFLQHIFQQHGDQGLVIEQKNLRHASLFSQRAIRGSDRGSLRAAGNGAHGCLAGLCQRSAVRPEHLSRLASRSPGRF
jgi:hypothetical protein